MSEENERLRAKVEAREPTAGQQDLGAPGLVVRLYDHGPDGAAKPELLFCSERRHGSAGTWGDSEEARAFADQLEAGWRELEAQRAAVQADRRSLLEARQGPRFVLTDEAAEEARAAAAKKKKATEEIRRLYGEAHEPEITVDCPLDGSGYRVVLAPSLSDGTVDEAEGRVLAASGPQDTAKTSTSRRRHGPAADPSMVEEVMAATETKKRSRGKKAAPRPGQLPESVPDVEGLPISIGSEVNHPGTGIEGARLTKILRLDGDLVIVEIEDTAGIPSECASTELQRCEANEGMDPGAVQWPSK